MARNREAMESVMNVTITNVKGIKLLDFDLPRKDVWVVTGLNGSGKTSLFAAIYRIGSQNAFQKYYKTSTHEAKLDSVSEAAIKYSVNDESVIYRYGGSRWRATPRKNAGILKKFPYKTIEYVEANGERIEPFAYEILPRLIRNASAAMIDFMCQVLADEKWRNLKYVNTKSGSGNVAFLIPYKLDGKTYYYSEKNFSLGELCVLKLAKKITTILNGSLVLIDEVEMALHPQAQVRLFRLVSELAKVKSLVVLFSTHSVSLIKNAKKDSLIFLRAQADGVVSVVRGAFPAQILGDLAFDDEINADFIIFVEDKQAKFLAEQMLNKYMCATHEEKLYQPLFKVVPVGGYVQVLEMLKMSSAIFPSHVKRFALLDKDVEEESLKEARKSPDNNKVLLELFESVKGRVNYLPCTPEVGVVHMLEEKARDCKILANKIERAFAGSVFSISDIVSRAEYLALGDTKEKKKDQDDSVEIKSGVDATVKAQSVRSESDSGKKVRGKAKLRLKYFVKAVIEKTNEDSSSIVRVLYGAYTEEYYRDSLGELKKLLGPFFSAR